MLDMWKTMWYTGLEKIADCMRKRKENVEKKYCGFDSAINVVGNYKLLTF